MNHLIASVLVASSVVICTACGATGSGEPRGVSDPSDSGSGGVMSVGKDLTPECEPSDEPSPTAPSEPITICVEQPAELQEQRRR